MGVRRARRPGPKAKAGLGAGVDSGVGGALWGPTHSATPPSITQGKGECQCRLPVGNIKYDPDQVDPYLPSAQILGSWSKSSLNPDENNQNI